MRKISRAFYQVFFSVVLLTLLAGSGSFWLAQKDNLSLPQNRVFEICNTTWNMRVVAIFGFLGARAIDITQEQREKE